jgi:hypothetical protein
MKAQENPKALRRCAVRKPALQRFELRTGGGRVCNFWRVIGRGPGDVRSWQKPTFR